MVGLRQIENAEKITWNWQQQKKDKNNFQLIIWDFDLKILLDKHKFTKKLEYKL